MLVLQPLASPLGHWAPPPSHTGGLPGVAPCLQPTVGRDPAPTSQAGSSGPALGGPASREAWLVICVATWPQWQPHWGWGRAAIWRLYQAWGGAATASAPRWPTELPPAGGAGVQGEEQRIVPSHCC